MNVRQGEAVRLTSANEMFVILYYIVLCLGPSSLVPMNVSAIIDASSSVVS